MSEESRQKDEEFSAPERPTNLEAAAALDKELASERDKMREGLNAANDQPVQPQPEPEVKDEQKEQKDDKPVDDKSKSEPVFDEVTGRYRDPVTKAFVADPNKPKDESDKTGETKASEDQVVKTGEPEAGGETPYAKAQKAEKDAARLARVVEQRQREVEEARREAAEWKARAEQGPSSREESRNETHTKFNSDQFARAADEFTQQGFKHLENGEAEAAMEAFTWARKAQGQAQDAYKAEQEQAVRQQQETFTRTWQDTVQETIKRAAQEDVDLMDENGEDSKAVIEILETEEILNYLPDGFKKAYELHQLRKAYDEKPKLLARIKELEEANAKLTGNATPSKGQRVTRSGPKKFEDMSMAEQREYLRANQYK